jgi:flagellar assembly protein FliH
MTEDHEAERARRAETHQHSDHRQHRAAMITVRSPHSRILRGSAGTRATLAEMVAVELLPVGTDGAPISAAAQQARDAGFQVGHAAGMAAGEVEGRERAFHEFTSVLAPKVDAMTAAIAALQTADAVTIAEVSDHLIAFAFSVAQAVLGRELELDNAPVRAALTRALALVPDRGDVVVRVHPDDAGIVGSVDDLLPGRVVTLIGDPLVERAGAVVQVGACRIDGQLGPALERVRHALGLM